MSNAGDSKLSRAQQRALGILDTRGYISNGPVPTSTIRALARRGVVEIVHSESYLDGDPGNQNRRTPVRIVTYLIAVRKEQS